MAEIPVEKKSSNAWIWILLALVLLGLIIWWIAAANDDDDDYVETDAVVQQDTMGDTGMTASGMADETGAMADANANASAGGLTLAAITANPQQYFGQQFSGQVQVGDNLTDRGFWIEQDGNRMFALINDQPREVPKDINPGQTLRISGGKVHDASSLNDIPGDALDQDTRRVIDDQAAFLLVDESNIDILQQG